MATWIKASGEEEEVAPARGRTFSLQELQRYVGGYIEIQALSDGRMMVLNEEGKLRGFELNRKATALYRVNVKIGELEILREEYPDDVVGDVLICGPREVD